MSTATATTTSPVSGLTDEQQDFVEAIRDFAKRECGTAEQREQLTENHTEVHNAEIAAKLGELGWLGASAAAWSMPACCSRRPFAACCRSVATR
jgi:hypothetical protein